MTQSERWEKNYEEVVTFLKENGRNLSKYNLEERRLFTWLKHNRKILNSGTMSPERKEKFETLLASCEEYRRKNQFG